MNQMFLIVTIAGRRIAIDASQIHSVVQLDAITPIPDAPPFVAGPRSDGDRLQAIIGNRAGGFRRAL